jgi:hypothetical protein
LIDTPVYTQTANSFYSKGRGHFLPRRILLKIESFYRLVIDYVTYCIIIHNSRKNFLSCGVKIRMCIIVNQKHLISVTVIILLCVGKLILSSMPSFVCDGDDITLTCNSSNGRMRWTVILPESVIPYPITRQISSTKVAATEEAFRITVNRTISIFHIQRRSDYNTTPLVASLLIENVSAGINETNISCSSVPNSDSENKQFMILIIDDNHRHGKLNQ